MNQNSLDTIPVQAPVLSLARLSEPHGYRFEGDKVHLHARFAVLDPAAHLRKWALQLRACPSAPASARDLAGQIVAEVALPPMSEVADENEHMEMSGLAFPPAGSAEYFMALVLAAGRPGQFDEVHDIAVYPRRQSFLQPRMRGTVGYRIDGNKVHFSIEHIENPRDVANLSGTLALELWALAAPYKGGIFHGVHLGGVVIGSLLGGTESTVASFEAPFTAPPPGKWHFVLMLREWTAAGYVTRDFTQFSILVVYEPVAAPPPPKIQAPAPAETAAAKPAAPPQAALMVWSKEVAAIPAEKAVAIGDKRPPTNPAAKPPVAPRQPRKQRSVISSALRSVLPPKKNPPRN